MADWSRGEGFGGSRGQEAGRGKERAMATLASERCVACQRGAPTVTAAETAELKPNIPDWTLLEVDGEPRLERTFAFPDFAAAIAFTNQVAALAEEEGHHPAILTEWGKVTVAWWTHKIHGLHRNDFIMAAKTDQLYEMRE
jgi:4a-hydroxytetrahydrobiopterin dehydratase